MRNAELIERTPQLAGCRLGTSGLRHEGEFTNHGARPNRTFPQEAD